MHKAKNVQQVTSQSFLNIISKILINVKHSTRGKKVNKMVKSNYAEKGRQRENQGSTDHFNLLSPET